jgi:hypothetical protein
LVLKLPNLIFLILLLSINAFADNNKTQSDSVIDNVETISYDLLELETQLDMGMDTFDIKIEARDIRNQLLYQEHKLGTPRGGDEQWNESEMAILNAKKNLQALEEKIKLEGDWGKIRLRMLDLKGDDPGSVKLRYNYGF